MYNISLALLSILLGALVFFGTLSHKALRIASLVVGILSILAFTFLYLKPGSLEIVKLGVFAMSFNLTEVSQFFLWIIIASFVLSLFSLLHEERSAFFYLYYFLAFGFAALTVMANDLLTLYMNFELMSLSVFAILLLGVRGNTKEIAFKYMVYSLVGAYFYLGGLFLKFRYSGNIGFGPIVGASTLTQIGIFALLALPFLVKIATMPFHNWAPDAYYSASDSFTVFFSAGLSKVGVYGLAILILKTFTELFKNNIYLPEVIAWIGGITALLGGIYAFMSDDAKKLLAYSSISQLGYVLVGLGLFTPYSFSAGIFHSVAHFVFEGVLFVTVAAVIHRVGTSDLRKMGGLIKKMPISFIGLLFGIIAGSGIPPTVGFPGKWLLYEAIIMKGDLFLVSLIFFASITAFLYSYKLVHSIFLGKLHKEHRNVKEAPLGYVIATILFLVPLIVFGVFPGVLFEKIYAFTKPVFNHDAFFTLDSLKTQIGFAKMTVAGITLVSMFVISFILYLISGRSYRAKQEDNYTAGEWVDEDFASHYAQEFYGFMRKAFGKLLDLSAEKFWNGVLSIFKAVAEMTRRIYTGDVRDYALYLLFFLIVLVFLVGGRL
ncbi:MAG: proton-conducting transporter membrane subunit [candidate division WOR-3 bacterium]